MNSQSLTYRAILSLLLLAGFYIVAIGIAALLVYIPYAELIYTHQIYPKIAIFCLIGAAIILWSIIPRGERFTPPGPQLLPEENPKLFKVIEEVAKSTGQDMPSAVYLIFDVNAWVSQAGGFLGLGGKRVMGLGLPLMQLLTVSQLRAIIAHEFGHYYGGDTKLSPIIYRTRSAIGRTLNGLQEHSTLLQKPFILYGNMFLRVSHGISRNQEYVADKLASEIAGTKAFINGLRKIHGTAPAFDYYWRYEVAPLLDAGLRPPLADGFSRYLGAAPIINIIDGYLKEEEVNSNSDPYDTHPSLSERIKAVEKLPDVTYENSDETSISLLNEVEKLEALLFLLLFGEETKDLKTIGWNDIGIDLYIDKWTELIRTYKEQLNGISIQTIPDNAAGLQGTLYERLQEARKDLSTEEVADLGQTLIGVLLALNLRKQGWRFQKAPGYPIAFVYRDNAIRPFSIVKELVDGAISTDQWNELIAKAGITNIELDNLGGES